MNNQIITPNSYEFSPKNFTFFKKPTEYDMSELKLEGLRNYARIIQWGRSNPVRFCSRFFGIEFLDYQKYVFMMSWITPYVVWCMSRNAGKALDLNTPILTPVGYKKMKDIHVGSYVFNEHGSPTKVTYESPVYTNHDCYEVVFSDGEVIVADGEHNWYVFNRQKNTYEICVTKELYNEFLLNHFYDVPLSHNLLDKKTITKIIPTTTRPVKCIQVESTSHLYLCGINNTITHNTTLGSPFLMAKTLLLPNFEAYILSGNGSQSIGMMKKIESIAKKEIASFTGLTDLFLNELVKTSNSDGFKHDPASYSYKMYGGSSLATLNSNFDGSRGRRSRLNFYDEASYVSEDMYAATLPFTTQNSDFALGADSNIELRPPNFKNQIIHASSAGSMDDYFYKMYKEYSMHSLAGDKNYFCADIDCDVVLSATYNGKVYPVPLLTQDKIDSEMKTNPTKAMREYKNKFDSDLGDDIAIKKSQIIRNSIPMLPMLVNTDNSLIGISFDPAKKKDNAFVLIGKFVEDPNKGWMLHLVNGINLIDKETHKPLTTPEMIARLKEIIVKYNGYSAPDYVNIQNIYIDAGSGGGATQICDFLFEDFYEEGYEGDSKYKHRGLIDKTYDYAMPYISRYPNAIDKIRLKEPSKYKTIMYSQTCEMIEQDLIKFTMEYDYHGTITYFEEENGEMVERIHYLTEEEEVALKQLDALKEEATHMYKYKASNGNIRYDLAPGFENILHDDRSYCLALLGHALFELRSNSRLNNSRSKESDNDILNSLIIRPANYSH